MRIANHTHWQTAQIKTFLSRVAKDECDQNLRKRLIVRVVYNRGGQRHASCSGHAYYHSPYMTIKVPSGQIDRVDLAHTIAHEMAHCRGMRHRQMQTPRYARIGDWRERHAWADQLPLEKQLPKATPPVDPTTRAQQCLAHAQAMVKKWETKLKATKTRLDGWKRKARYYEKKLTVMLQRAAMMPHPVQE